MSQGVERGWVQVDYIYHCGRCSGTYAHKDTSRAYAARNAKDWGWKWTRKYGWVCPDCAEEP